MYKQIGFILVTIGVIGLVAAGYFAYKENKKENKKINKTRKRKKYLF